MFGRVSDGVEFVVSHDDLGVSAVDHVLDDFEDTQLLTTAVDQIADKDRLSFGICECAVFTLISEFGEQGMQSGRAAMNVADDVVALHEPI